MAAMRATIRTRAPSQRSTAASTAAADPPAPSTTTDPVVVRQAEVAADRGVEPADVGVVADERAIFGPERVHRADALRRPGLRAPQSAANASLCGTVTFPAASRVAQESGDGREPRRRHVDRLVRERDPRAAQRGVLHRRRERMRDGMAEQHEPRRAGPLRRPAAARTLAGDAVEHERDDALELVHRAPVDLEASAERVDDRAPARPSARRSR